MCTLVVMAGIWPGYPLIVAANRDEVPGRPTADPGYLSADVFAPRDLVAGGSWIGVNRRGLFVALTNRSLRPRVRGRRSRGLLVTESLASPSLAAAAALVTDTPAGTYNGFNLVLADGRAAVLFWTDGGKIFRQPILPGLHVCTGSGYGPGHSSRATAVHGRLADLDFRSRPSADLLFGEILGFHGPGPEDGTCVHGPGVFQETLCSTLVALDSVGGRWHWEHRLGRPCAGPRPRSVVNIPLVGGHHG